MLKRFAWAIAVFIMPVLSSCSFSEHLILMNSPKEYEYDDVMVSGAMSPLYANLGSVSNGSDTRSYDEELVSLESLLDRNQTRVARFEQYHLKEIPFKSNSSPSFAVLSDEVLDSVDDLSLTTISLFLVEVTDTVSNIVDRKVITLIPDKDYAETCVNSDYSYINKGVFSGVILFSDLDGRFRDVYMYGGHYNPIFDSDIVHPSEMASCSRSCVLSLVRWNRTRTSGDGDDGSSGNVELEGSICIGFTEPPIEPDWPSPGNSGIGVPGTITDGNENSGLSGGGAGGSNSGVGVPSDNGGDNNSGGEGSTSGNNGNSNGTSLDNQPFNPDGEEVMKYLISLSAGEGGTTSGGGFYSPGTFVTCEAKPNSLHLFDRWVGDFKGHDDALEFMVTKSVFSTAYFRSTSDSGPVRPCYDASRKMYNPLKEMILAPTDSAGKRVVAATFGDDVRYEGGRSKKHTGLDLYAPEGTPVYAMYDGKISDRKYVLSQPNRNKESSRWPEDYSGDKDGAGNRFIIESQINGDTYYFLFWHMQAGTPVAVNPRTGNPFSPGDVVYAGEVVGYTGRTGNAYNVPFHHLHLGVQNSSYLNINPELLINGELQWEDGSRKKILNREVINIRCDSEVQDSYFGL